MRIQNSVQVLSNSSNSMIGESYLSLMYLILFYAFYWFDAFNDAKLVLKSN
jgi:hypothetical protein